MSSHDPQSHETIHASGVDFDRREPSTVWVIGFAIASLVVLVAIIIGVKQYFDFVEEQQVYEKQMLPIAEDFKQLRSKEDHDLRTYGWADKAAGAVRIPLDKAAELYLAELAAGKVKYPTTPQPVKVETALPPGSPAQAAAPQGGATNAQPAAR